MWTLRAKLFSSVKNISHECCYYMKQCFTFLSFYFQLLLSPMLLYQNMKENMIEKSS